MKKLLTLILGLTLALLVLTALPYRIYGSTTTLTGTIKDAQGNPLNGWVTMQLPVSAVDTSTNTNIPNTLVSYSVVNGAIQSGPPLYDVANLSPANLYYIGKVYNSAGALVETGYYVVTGASFDFGSAVPTTVTTNNVSYVSPVSASANNTFTGLNIFTQQLTDSVATGTAPFAITSTTLVPNLNVNVLNGVTLTGTPSVGDNIVATSATAAHWASGGGAAASTGCTVYTPVTVSNSTSSTNLQSCSLAANSLSQGSMVEIDATGVLTQSASSYALQIQTNFSANVCTGAGAAGAAANNQPWNAVIKIFVLTAGASGTANMSCEFFSTPSGGGVAGPSGVVGTPTFALNTTVSQLIQINEQMSVANAGNSVTEQGLKAVIF